MVLLTSSQASVAISSGIVVLFTLALFLSGYAIQQRTLRDLRKAIRPDPRPSPKIYLPDRFKQSTTELSNGRVIELDDDFPSSPRQIKQKEVTIDVRPTVPEDAAQKPMKQEKAATGKRDGKKRRGDKTEEEREEPMTRAERRRRIKQDIRDMSQGEGPVYYQRRLW
ncbi:hypothetical protein BJ170DRAFT_619191 [Xylariales sp. AK1849]|nr:hypothetical protein BJ170DRAFT_619191 [Xylariales sp. AK1849]